MSNYKYYDTSEINKYNLFKRRVLKKKNELFYWKMDSLYSDYLVINGYPLDSIQKKVVFSDNKYTMVIAGAGSGKSTTMIGKIKYLTGIKHVNPDDILVISFTNESVNSFKTSLEKNNIFGIKVLTFHKLALLYIDNRIIVGDDYLKYIISEYLLSNYYSNKKEIIKKAFKVDNYKTITNNISIYCKELIKLINLCHTNDFKLNDFFRAKKVIMRQFFWHRLSLLCLLYMIMDIYYLYQEEKHSIGALDFDDMIIKATNNVSNHNINYKYIIVDEYQDTSLIRVKLLQEIIKIANAKLVVVGDDYQSIYRFNGCDLNIFLDFKKYFQNSQVFKLQNTYRNSQDLINITKRFILKNPYQIRKKIVSFKRLLNPIKIVYYNNANKEDKLIKLIKWISDNHGNYLILGRNNFDLRNITEKKFNYLTIHKSKGLEADNVVIINLENSLYGIPNKIKTPKIENILFNNKSKYLYDEERRLFYVALTRTKNYVFLFVNKNNPSIFIKELLKDNIIEILQI